jgi:hypothetical protein
MHKDREGPLVLGPIWDLNEAFGLCCGYPIEGNWQTARWHAGRSQELCELCLQHPEQLVLSLHTTNTQMAVSKLLRCLACAAQCRVS